MNEEHVQTISRVVEELSLEERRKVAYLCGDLEPESCLGDLRGMLRSLTVRGRVGPLFLLELMLRMRRFDILKKILGTTRQEVEGLLKNSCVLSDYRLLMADLSENMDSEDLRSLIFLLSETLPRGKQETATCFLDVVAELEKMDKVSSEKMDLIKQCLRNIHRKDLAKKVERYQRTGTGTQNVMVPNHRIRPRLGVEPCQMVQSSAPFPLATCPQPVKANAQENIKMSVPETGRLYCQGSMEMYQMHANPRGLCVIIDCVGQDGDMLEQAFQLLHFRVVQHKWPSVAQTRNILKEVSARRRVLQESDAFACCILSRTAGHSLLATEARGPGLGLDTVRQIFSNTACPGLAGKPKLFFIQSYSEPRLAQFRHTYRDEDLETDGPTVAAPVESVPSDADVFWSHCSTEGQWLEEGTHSSVYLRALCAALMSGQKRNRDLLDIHTEVNSVIYEHNERSAYQKYTLSLRHTLRKLLVLS